MSQMMPLTARRMGQRELDDAVTRRQARHVRQTRREKQIDKFEAFAAEVYDSVKYDLRTAVSDIARKVGQEQCRGDEELEEFFMYDLESELVEEFVRAIESV